MKIEERITEHRIAREKLIDRKLFLEEEINTIEDKIVYHLKAISNLEIKKHRND